MIAVHITLSKPEMITKALNLRCFCLSEEVFQMGKHSVRAFDSCSKIRIALALRSQMMMVQYTVL